MLSGPRCLLRDLCVDLNLNAEDAENDERDILKNLVRSSNK
jgi:hypothetical protein